MNLAGFSGEVVMLTLTGPGGSEFDVWAWNQRMYQCWKRLAGNAKDHANRKVKGQRTGLLSYTPELQKRGALHLHIVLGAETKLEKRWCEAFGRYCRKNAVKHGFGPQAHLGSEWASPQASGKYVSKLARYLSKAGGVRTMWENGELPSRAFYVSRRLTSRSGCTIRMMRRRGAAWAKWRVGVPVRALGEWTSYERAFRRRLTMAELLGVDGVVPRRT